MIANHTSQTSLPLALAAAALACLPTPAAASTPNPHSFPSPPALAQFESPLAPLGDTSGLAPAATPVQAKILADVADVAPGHKFKLAITLTLTEGWHIYWRDPGGPGLPTQIRLDMPDGFSAEPTQYPAPSRFVTPPDISSYGYEHRATFLIDLAAPGRLDAREITIAAHVTWLACKDVCIPGQADLQLKLPVLADPAAAPAPANAELFRQAAAALPVPAQQARHVTTTTYLSADPIRPGDSFVAAILLQTNPPFRFAESDDPAQLVELFLEKTKGIDFEPPLYTTSDPTTSQPDQVLIRIPAKAAADLPVKNALIRGLGKPHLRPLAASADIPESDAQWLQKAVEFEIPLPVGPPGTPVKPMHPEVFGTARPPGPTAAPASPSTQPQETQRPPLGFLARVGLPGLLLACALYGLSLNATPCVLPIVSIKVVGFIQQAGQQSRRALGLGLAFGIGVVLLFIVLGFLAAVGKNVLQYPPAVIALGAIVMALALSMLGVYSLQPPSAASQLEGKIAGETLTGSFGKGLLAPVLGFACTGPLLAGAFAWASRQPPSIAVLAFVAAGLGMAAPYILLSAFPAWLRLLPKPGPWMITFERVMGFVLLAAVVWLLHPLIYQVGPAGLEWTAVFLIAVAAACWVLGKATTSSSAGTRWGYRGTAAGIIMIMGLLVYGWIYPLGSAAAQQAELQQPTAAVDWNQTIPWNPYTPQAVESAVQAGSPAFVEFTAAYCTICKANLKLYIDTPEVRAKMRQLNVVPFRGDFTTGDPEIFSVLQRYGRIGVPLYLVYIRGRPDRPIVLPTTISKQMILTALTVAGTSPPRGPVSVEPRRSGTPALTPDAI